MATHGWMWSYWQWLGGDAAVQGTAHAPELAAAQLESTVHGGLKSSHAAGRCQQVRSLNSPACLHAHDAQHWRIIYRCMWEESSWAICIAETPTGSPGLPKHITASPKMRKCLCTKTCPLWQAFSCVLKHKAPHGGTTVLSSPLPCVAANRLLAPQVKAPTPQRPAATLLYK